jgi:hypothetical protein
LSERQFPLFSPSRKATDEAASGCGWRGQATSAEADFHYALTFAAVYQALGGAILVHELRHHVIGERLVGLHQTDEAGADDDAGFGGAAGGDEKQRGNEQKTGSCSFAVRSGLLAVAHGILFFRPSIRGKALKFGKGKAGARPAVPHGQLQKALIL